MRNPQGRAFASLSLSIMRGFIRDRAAVFFAIVFPLMFLVLFGGIFNDQDQSPIDMIQVGDVALVDQMPKGARAAFDESFDVTRSDDLADALTALLDHPAERQRLGAAGIRRAAEFTWDTAAKQHVEVYERVAAS